MKYIKFLTIALIILFTFNISAKAEFFSDVIVTSPNGIWTDSRAYSSLNAAITAVGANQRTVVIASPQLVTNLTIPSNVTLKFERDGAINNTGQLTINTRNIIADDHQIFIGLGDIDFASGTVVRLSWFHNLWNALTMTSDDTVTLLINKSINATASAAVGNNVTLKWDSQHIITANAGVTISNIGQITAGYFQLLAGAGNFIFRDGALLNLKWFTHLRAAITWIGTTKATILIDSLFPVDYSDSVPSNIQLKLSIGGELAISPGIILTLSNARQVDIGPYLFNPFSGNGSILLNGITYAPATALTAEILSNLSIYIQPRLEDYEVDALYDYGNGVNYTDTVLMASCTAIGSDKSTILVRPGAWVFSSNRDFKTVCANTVFKFANGAYLDYGAYSIVMPGDPDARPDQQIYNGTGAVTGMKNVSAKWFGAGSAAISQAIVAASGGKLLWPAGTYSVATEITAVLTGASKWVAEGPVTVKYTGATNDSSIIFVETNKNDFSIDGPFTVDADSKTRIGLKVYNRTYADTQADEVNLLFNGVTVKNVYSTTVGSGSWGILVSGAARLAKFDNCRIYNVSRAVGVGVAGSVGTHGLLVTYAAGVPSGYVYVRQLVVNDSIIDTVTSDEASGSADYADMDGINYQTPYAGNHTPTGIFWDTKLIVRGGTFRNCTGRSIKSHSTATTLVDGVKFIRDSAGKVGIVSGMEIDIQIGAVASIVNNTAHYEALADTTTPFGASFAFINGSVNNYATNEGALTITGNTVFNDMASTSPMPVFAQISGSGSSRHSNFIVNNNTILGNGKVNVFVWNSNYYAKNMVMNNNYANMSLFIYHSATVLAARAYVNASGNYNSGTTAYLQSSAGAPNSIISGNNNYGFYEVGSLSNGFTVKGVSGGGLYRAYAEATANIEADASTTITLSIPAGARILGAQLRVDSALATGETWDAAYSGGSTTAISTANAVAKSTKSSVMYNENGATPITTNTTNIAITKNGGGSFTAQGTIRAIVYYETLLTLSDAP